MLSVWFSTHTTLSSLFLISLTESWNPFFRVRGTAWLAFLWPRRDTRRSWSHSQGLMNNVTYKKTNKIGVRIINCLATNTWVEGKSWNQTQEAGWVMSPGGALKSLLEPTGEVDCLIPEDYLTCWVVYHDTAGSRPLVPEHVCWGVVSHFNVTEALNLWSYCRIKAYLYWADKGPCRLGCGWRRTSVFAEYPGDAS